ncbi:MAG: YIP1 family protein [Candidatus Omnitrophota bacterium]|nr:hypothetical protein [Candidatus Omnitrophota bacterium]MBU2528233.1 hypothetical protein [bacterium]MBU3929611.1 hypothetical protein [bacterium]MBU4122208.1 hypothetical protein [bacterium]
MTAGNFYSIMFSPGISWDEDNCRDSFSASALFFIACRFFQFTAFSFASADFILFLPVIFFEWMASAAILHFFAHSFGGRGSVTDFFRLLPFAELPFLFLPAAKILASSILSSFTGAFTLMAVMIYVWSFALKIKAMMFNYRLSSERALAAFAAPALIVFILSAAALFLRAAVLLI